MEILVAVLIVVVVILAKTGQKTDRVVKKTMSGEGSSDEFGGFALMLIIVAVVFFTLLAMADTGGLDETWEITGADQRTGQCFINCD